MARKRIKWFKLVTRPQTALTVDFIYKGLVKELPNIIRVNLDTKAEFHKGLGTVYEGVESRKCLNEKFEEKQKDDPNFFRDHLAEGKKRFSRLINSSKKIGESNLNVDNQKLLKYLENYNNNFYKYAPFLHTVFAPEAVLTKQLKRQIGEHFKGEKAEKIEEYFRILTTVQESSDFYLEQKALFELAIKSGKGKNIDEDVSDIWV
jgi:hypothetical protein